MSFDVVRELRRTRNFAATMLIVTILGLVAFDSDIMFAILVANSMVWLVRFWYFTSQLYEHGLVIDDLHRRDG